MPTSSSARLSAPISTSAGSRRTKASSTQRRSNPSTPSASSSQTKPSSTARATKNQDDAATRPPLATAEIIEKATLPLHGLSTRDALTVWKALGLYLGEQLTQRRRVISVDRFGVFGYNDAGEAVFVHSSVFLQSHRLRDTVGGHGLKGQPALAANADPMSKVNALEISQEYLQNCGREVVEKVVTHVVAFIGTAAKQGRSLRLSLAPLGEWVCSGETAAFKFLPEFQQQMMRSASMRKPPNDEATKPATKETRTPDEMRARGRSAREEELRVVEPTLTAATLEDHTVHAGAEKTTSLGTSSYNSHKGTRNQQHASHPSNGTTRSSRRVGWSETDASNDPAAGTRGREQTPGPATKTPKTNPTTKTKTQQLDVPVGGIVGRVRAKLLARCGDNGLNALQRVLSLLDTSGDGVLSAQELKFGLRDLGIELSASELQQVVTYFDRNADGVVSLDELLNKLRGALSDRRRRLIDRAFDCVDSKRRGVVSLDDLRDNYDVSLLPRVRAGKKTRAQALHEFLREWETSVEHNNGISREAFLEYYHNVSACIADDSDFELLMRQTWHVSVPDSEPESDSDDDVVPVHKQDRDQRQRDEQDAQRTTSSTSASAADEWMYLRSVLLPPRVGVHTHVTLDDVCRRLGVNRVWGDGHETMNTRAFANALVKLDRSLHSKDAQHLAHVVATYCSHDTSSSSDGIALTAVFQLLTGASPPHEASAVPTSSPSTGVAGIVERIRARLLHRLKAHALDTGESGTPPLLGLHALQRTLRLLDSNGDKRLTKDELKIGLRKVGVDVNFHELDQLFTCLDADRSGCIDSDEFLTAMRGGDDALTQNPRRLRLVHQAFDLLDRDRDGTVTLQELSRAYDTSKHPDVLAGRVTAADALQQFAQQWDTLEPDGVITRQEFETYYRNVSAVVDSDDYFELMMRNAWHLSGGVGPCANTSNRRVLVTHDDGTERIHEVQNDLGIRASDRDQIQQNLRAQGITAKEFTSHGYVDDKNKPNGVRTGTTAGRPPWRREHPTTSNTKEGTATRQQRGRGSMKEIPTPDKAGAAPSDFFATTYDHDERADTLTQRRHDQRQRRERAALLIQAQFRGFKCRKFVDCVRRQMAAGVLRKQREADDQAPRKRVVTRAPLKSFYGF